MPKNILSSTIVLEVLGEDNYENWSVCIKNYLLAQDLWDIIEATTEPPKSEDDAVKFNTWRKNNAAALHAIQISCAAEILSKIKHISSAKIAWDTLANMYVSPPTIEPDNSSDTVVLANSSDNPGTEINNVNNGDLEFAALHKAVTSGDWNAAKVFLNQHPRAVSAKLKFLGKTALHTAVDCGHEHIVKELMELLSEQDLEIQDGNGRTALALTTFRGGSEQMAKCMLRKNKNMVSIQDGWKFLPVVSAISYGYIDLARYLYSLTPLEDLKPDKGISGATLITQSIYSRTFDIALDLLRRCPPLALAQDSEKCSPVYALACMPYAFPSGYRSVFWKPWISSCTSTPPGRPTNEIRMDIQKLEKQRSFQKIRSGISQIYEMKSIHAQSCELLRLMCEQISTSNLEQRKDGCVYRAIFRAIKEGIFEFLYEVVRTNPDLLWSYDENSRSIFLSAVQYRQAKIFSLLYGLDVKNTVVYTRDKFYNNILHIAGMSTTSIQPNRITGAALQLQRELQWFKEVESIVLPKVKEALNKDGLTPRELFTRDHKDMLKEGEQWMKETATSCTVVGALIITIMFAAAFAVPGGNDQNTGFPMFLKENLFKLFIVSDALSLFSSSTSVLMFLGILTSRYAEEDFLFSLPTKMIIGLSTLFFSIATMMIAFSAGLSLMVRESWMVIPVICLASVPITLFVLMQFPLLVDMSISTYGSGIFDRKMKCWI